MLPSWSASSTVAADMTTECESAVSLDGDSSLKESGRELRLLDASTFAASRASVILETRSMISRVSRSSSSELVFAARLESATCRSGRAAEPGVRLSRAAPSGSDSSASKFAPLFEVAILDSAWGSGFRESGRKSRSSTVSRFRFSSKFESGAGLAAGRSTAVEGRLSAIPVRSSFE